MKLISTLLILSFICSCQTDNSNSFDDILGSSSIDPNNPNPACNQAVWGTHSGSIQAFYADAVPFTFSAENSELSLVVGAVANTVTPDCPPG